MPVPEYTNYGESRLDTIGEMKQKRAAQRRFFLRGIDSSTNVNFIERLFPVDRTVHYTEHFLDLYERKEDDTRYGDDLRIFMGFAEKDPGGSYRLLLELACTATNSYELRNIFAALGAIGRIGSNPFEPMSKKVTNSLIQFMEISHEPQGVSDEAKTIRQKVIKFCLSNTNIKYPQILAMDLADNFFRPSSQFFKNHYTFLSEAYLYTVLHPKTPIDIKEVLLLEAQHFFFEQQSTEGIPLLSIEDEKCSVWMRVDASWVDPRLDIVQLNVGNEPSRQLFKNERAYIDEIAQLRKKIEQLVEERGHRNTQLDEEIDFLHKKRDDLQRAHNILSKQYAELTAENVNLRNRLQQAERDLIQRRDAESFGEETIGQFLGRFSLNPQTLEKMSPGKRGNWITLLRRNAFQLHHPEGGSRPNQELLKKINEYFDKLSGKP